MNEEVATRVLTQQEGKSKSKNVAISTNEETMNDNRRRNCSKCRRRQEVGWLLPSVQPTTYRLCISFSIPPLRLFRFPSCLSLPRHNTWTTTYSAVQLVYSILYAGFIDNPSSTFYSHFSAYVHTSTLHSYFSLQRYLCIPSNSYLSSALTKPDTTLAKSSLDTMEGYDGTQDCSLRTSIAASSIEASEWQDLPHGFKFEEPSPSLEKPELADNIDALIEELESHNDHIEEEQDTADESSSCPHVPLADLQTNTRTGLTDTEVASRRKKYGLNQMRKEEKQHP